MHGENMKLLLSIVGMLESKKDRASPLEIISYPAMVGYGR